MGKKQTKSFSTLFLFALLLVLNSGSAYAGVGDLKKLSCINQAGGAGCTQVEGLDAPTSVAVHPSGKTLFVASPNSGSLSEYSIGEDGTLTQLACGEYKGEGSDSDNCSSDLNFRNVFSIAISPTGDHLYVVAGTDAAGGNAVTVLNLSPTEGTITGYNSCINAVGDNGCTAEPLLDHPYYAVINPTGTVLYVSSSNNNAVIAFQIKQDGDLESFAGTTCVSGSDPVPVGCSSTRVLSLQNPFQMALSSDGKSLYVASPDSSSITRLIAATSNGVPASVPANCLSVLPAFGGSTDCTSFDSQPFGTLGARGVTVAKDGKTVYGAGTSNSSLLAISRESNLGDMSSSPSTPICVDESGTTGCTDSDALSGALPLVEDPDGGAVYAGTFSDNASISRYELNSDSLDRTFCVKSNGSTSNAACETVDGLGQITDLKFSPDGKYLFVASPSNDTVLVFERGDTGLISPVTTTTPSSTSTSTVAPPVDACSSLFYSVSTKSLSAVRTVGRGLDGQLVMSKPYVLSSKGSSARLKITGSVRKRKNIKSVTFYIGSTKVSVDKKAPYKVSLPAGLSGKQSLKAKVSVKRSRKLKTVALSTTYLDCTPASLKVSVKGSKRTPRFTFTAKIGDGSLGAQSSAKFAFAAGIKVKTSKKAAKKRFGSLKLAGVSKTLSLKFPKRIKGSSLTLANSDGLKVVLKTGSRPSITASGLPSGVTGMTLKLKGVKGVIKLRKLCIKKPFKLALADDVRGTATTNAYTYTSSKRC